MASVLLEAPTPEAHGRVDSNRCQVHCRLIQGLSAACEGNIQGPGRSSTILMAPISIPSMDDRAIRHGNQDARTGHLETRLIKQLVQKKALVREVGVVHGFDNALHFPLVYLRYMGGLEPTVQTTRPMSVSIKLKDAGAAVAMLTSCGWFAGASCCHANELRMVIVNDIVPPFLRGEIEVDIDFPSFGVVEIHIVFLILPFLALEKDESANGCGKDEQDKCTQHDTYAVV
eukprot:CAMPEP_0180634624 /NCGR_PEP_ID=MMETSP1037_2-20121125/42228_1 /TAXON_ID=632150 /ORGANISM="Azadinium spinosum, Strain 3D9" /LENGTH=229 /DNA_ID=CAMNT_0022655773 /DNA_START=426 /DNA_END=1116 /DNA_ORIENTATION=-